MTGTQDCYGENSTLYADERVRPVYPDELFERIFTFAGSRSGTALDVGTGTGQCAQVLAKTFQQVNFTRLSVVLHLECDLKLVTYLAALLDVGLCHGFQ